MSAQGFFPPDKVFTVTEISGVIKNMLEGAIGSVVIEGEISNLKIAASGHSYFDLKDSQSLIASVLFKGYSRALEAPLSEGLLVQAAGELTAYARQSKYQLIVRSVSPKAQGSLYLAFEKLKKKLAAEGMFEQDRKRPIPQFPKRIGIVTSPSGAALRDILSILSRRGAGLEVVIAGTLVQGAGAKEEIARAIADLNELQPRPDVLLVGRGGGSMEDLWAFNEEIVARAIFVSDIPVISCVGHETDFTIADFVADLRAPTPSAAAELVVKNRADVKNHVSHLKNSLSQSLKLFYENTTRRYERARGPLGHSLEKLWQRRAQETDRIYERLFSSARGRADVSARRLELLGGKLAALAPKSVLNRGYAIVRSTQNGKVLTDASGAMVGDRIELEFRKGSLDCEVKQVKG